MLCVEFHGRLIESVLDVQNDIRADNPLAADQRYFGGLSRAGQ